MRYKSLKIALIILCSLQLSACKPLIDFMEGLKNRLIGITSENIILSPTPATLTNQPTVYRLATPLNVLGKDHDLCFALKDNYENHSIQQNEKDFETALNGGRITVSLTDQNGKIYTYPATGLRWSLYGEITGTGELSACMSCGCKEPLTIGSKITQVQVTSDKPIKILGSYWQSSDEEEKFAEKIPPKNKSQ